jgi:hypothetical protein
LFCLFKSTRAEKRFVALLEVNPFAWPGFDLRPVPRVPERFAYGFLPSRLVDPRFVKIGH